MRHDLRLGLKVLRVGIEKMANMAQRANLAPENVQILPDDLGVLEDVTHPRIIDLAQVLDLVDHLHDEGLVGGQEDAQYLQADLAEPFQLRLAHQFVEKLPELVGNLGGNRHHAARRYLVDQEADQVLGALLVGQQVFAAHAGGQGAQLQCHRVSVQCGEYFVQGRMQLLLGDVTPAIDQFQQRQQRLIDFRHADGEFTGGAHEPVGLVLQGREELLQAWCCINRDGCDLL